MTNKSKRKKKGGSKKKTQKGGLCLKAPNMDEGAPFHPVWAKEFSQKGGSKKKTQKGGTPLQSKVLEFEYTMSPDESDKKESDWQFIKVSHRFPAYAWVDRAHTTIKKMHETHYRTLPVGYSPEAKGNKKVVTANQAEDKYLEGYKISEKIREEKRLKEEEALKAARNKHNNYLKKTQSIINEGRRKRAENKARGVKKVENVIKEEKIKQFKLNPSAIVFHPKRSGKNNTHKTD